mmetsp:Transcript_142403/g.262456  ORF Transcript_142403/g.262456 Transcript_142403/m.262456 type:complete len:414 (-) Transcript_142403:192-1433(-)
MASKRVDPADGTAYSYGEICAYYKGEYTKKAIDAYWENTCYMIAKVAKTKRNRKGAQYHDWDDHTGWSWYGEGYAQWDSGRKWKGQKNTVEKLPEITKEDALKEMVAKAQQVYKQLPKVGRTLWKAMKVCIENTLSAGVVHFERALRDELEIGFEDFNMERQSGSQWVVTIKEGPRSIVCHASVRSEVLGSPNQNSSLLFELKRAARVVKNTLLDDGASWLHDLTNSLYTREEFLNQVLERQWDEENSSRSRKGKGKGVEDDPEYDRCSICNKSLSQDRLGGKHMCKIIASFKCCSAWTSHSGRYNVEEDRVMGQRCQRCGSQGVALDNWQLAKDEPSAGDIERPHRSELCEACDLYGNCRGAFFNPFEMAVAVESILGNPPQWELNAGGNLWTTEVRNEVVVLQPHVHVSVP